jgi:surface polysaccharide O-acyltransferase-like enzyme
MSKSRFLGIDCFRGLAAFAVVMIHAGGEIIYSESGTLQPDLGVKILVQACQFAVPFFLATSFYFTVWKLLKAPEQFSQKDFLSTRVSRLLIPYLLWSLIYFAFRALKAIQSPAGLAQLFQDPIFLIFFGGAGIHLYFLPLLFTGSLVIPLLHRFAFFHAPFGLSLQQLKVSAFLLVLCLGLYEWMFVSGNFFNLGANCLESPQGCSVAFQAILNGNTTLNGNPFLRWVGTEFAWIVRCCLYIFASAVLVNPLIQNHIKAINPKHAGIALAVFAIATIGGELEFFKITYFPITLYELGVSYGLFFAGLALSQSFPHSRWIQNIGNASFGIYLIHYLILVICTQVITKIFAGVLPTFPPLLFMMGLAIPCFALSWLLTHLLSKQPLLRRSLFSS